VEVEHAADVGKGEVLAVGEVCAEGVDGGCEERGDGLGFEYEGCERAQVGAANLGRGDIGDETGIAAAVAVFDQKSREVFEGRRGELIHWVGLGCSESQRMMMRRIKAEGVMPSEVALLISANRSIGVTRVLRIVE
jgi:hypothetical protein